MQRFEEGIIIPYKICTCYMHMGGKMGCTMFIRYEWQYRLYNIVEKAAV